MRAIAMALPWQRGAAESSRGFKSGLCALRLQGWRRRCRIVRPGVLRVSPAHVLGDVAPAAGPKAGQVLGGLDWPAGRRGDGKGERHLAAPDRRMPGEAE